jgi:hypothetical protein
MRIGSDAPVADVVGFQYTTIADERRQVVALLWLLLKV